MNPPPPGTTPFEVVIVRSVPAATLLAAVAEADDPAPEAVVTWRTTVPTVQVFVVVEGVTEDKFQVIVDPAHE
jgi:hypothetical protein